MPPISLYEPLDVQAPQNLLETKPSINFFDMLDTSRQHRSREIANELNEERLREVEAMQQAREMLRQQFQQAPQGKSPGLEEVAGTLGAAGAVDPYLDVQERITRRNRQEQLDKSAKMKTAIGLLRYDPKIAQEYAKSQGLKINLSSYQPKPIYRDTDAGLVSIDPTTGGYKVVVPNVDKPKAGGKESNRGVSKFLQGPNGDIKAVGSRDLGEMQELLNQGYVPYQQDDLLGSLQKKKPAAPQKEVMTKTLKDGRKVEVERLPDGKYRKVRDL